MEPHTLNKDVGERSTKSVWVSLDARVWPKIWMLGVNVRNNYDGTDNNGGGECGCCGDGDVLFEHINV